jgi:integrase
VRQAVRVVDGGAHAVPLRRQPPLVVGYEHFRMDRQGALLSPKTLHYYDETILPFLRWLEADGVRRFHIAQVKKILAACNPAVPTENLVVRLLVGSGLRREEVCGLAVVGPDGLSDVMTDSLGHGHVELRVRWNAGAKGRKSRRVPITAKLAAAIKRYEAGHRGDADLPQLLINEHGNPYQGPGIKSMMDRLTLRVGFRVHAHAFRHTFATVAAKMGWNFEHLRSAMGHSDYGVLQRYVRLATERDLGSRADWIDFIASNPAMAWK